jgi:hypothetical protein
MAQLGVIWADAIWDLAIWDTAIWDQVGGQQTVPDQFTFTDQNGIALEATVTSLPITVTGIDTGTTITVSGGTYDVNGSGSFTADPGTVFVGYTIRARHTASDAYLTNVTTTITIGGVSDTFTSTTRTEPAQDAGDINSPVRFGGMMIFG